MRVRAPGFDFSNINFQAEVMVHAVAALSGYFPDGEEFFVRSVRYYRPRLRDRELRIRVRLFCGQETAHAAAHTQLNTLLAQRGFLVQAMHTRNLILPGFIERWTPPIVRLAQTCAMEHYTAILATRMLTHREALTVAIGDLEIGRLMAWHSFEELEHKAVAVDVYRAVKGPEWLRIVTMLVITAAMLTTSVVVLGVSLARDPAIRRHPVRAWRGYRPVHRLWWPGIVKDVCAYLRPGFHPDDLDTRALLAAGLP